MGRALLGALLALCIVGPASAQTTTVPCRAGHFLSAATNNAQWISPGARNLCGLLSVTNITSTTALYLRVYDVAGPPNCAGPGPAPVLTFPVPVNGVAALNVAGFTIALPTDIVFNNGIGMCLTGAAGDTDNTAAVTGVQVNYGAR